MTEIPTGQVNGMIRVVALLLTGLLLLSGCSPMPRTPDTAVAVAQQFLQARAARQADTVYSLLSGNAQKAMTFETVANHLAQETVSFGVVGRPSELGDDWIQITVTDLAVSAGEQGARWPETRLILHYEAGSWRVAWVEPLLAAAARAYQNGRYGEELTLGAAIRTVDPFHFRGPLESHFAYRGLERVREAEWWLAQARELAAPWQLPEVDDAAARFMLGVNQPAEAAALARSALDTATPYVPDLYSRRWQADTMVVLGRALLSRGDRASAAAVAQQVRELDPQNATLAMFLGDLLPPPAPTP